MSDAFVVAIEGFDATRPLETLPRRIKSAALRAVNRTADRTRTDAARRIREQVNLPASYLGPNAGRLSVTQRARGDELEAVITGRQRPTSLARYATSSTPNQGGVSVQVAPGFARFMRRAFLIRLRAGSADLDTKANLGLAIRLRPGETIANKKRMVGMGGNLYLLYGASVDQVFRSVREDVAPDAQTFLAAEFSRLLEINA